MDSAELPQGPQTDSELPTNSTELPPRPQTDSALPTNSTETPQRAEPRVISIDDDDLAECETVERPSSRQDEGGRQSANKGDSTGKGKGLDDLLSDQKLTLQNEKGRYVRVKDTKRNRQRQEESMSKL